MDAMQSKIRDIMKEAGLDKIAAEMIAKIHTEICDYADAISIARCEEKGVEDFESHDAQKIYYAAEAMIVAAVIRHMTDINNHA